MGMGYALAILLGIVVAAPFLWVGGWLLSDFLELFTGHNTHRSGPRAA